jgi:hypothetical protein
MKINDVDQCWVGWRDLFLTAVEAFVPKIKLKDTKSPKWIDSEIIKLSKKNIAYGNLPSNLTLLHSGTGTRQFANK